MQPRRSTLRREPVNWRQINSVILVLLLSTLSESALLAQRQVLPEPPLEPAGQQQELALFAPTTDGRIPEVPALAAGMPHPAAFLGYPLGTRFTHHSRILDYLAALASASDRVRLEEYGRTYEGRPLTLAVFSSPKNLERLDQLRANQLRLANPDGQPAEVLNRLQASQPVVVWLAYGVHGNESSSTEAALATAYVLTAAEREVASWLEHTIVVMDPLVNPDGRERYVHWFETQQGRSPNPQLAASEHWEAWPGGRQNHYLIDLNRDWAWASQRESQHRLAAYQRFEPQVFVDFHEMEADSSYFFPPPAEPISAAIDPGLIQWFEIFGRQNAAAFDRHGWLYYVRETFDVFYPGYGDAYPSLRGAVGMTYEMAGGDEAGLVVELTDKRRLNLADRIARHFTTSLTTIKTAAANRRALLQSFVKSRTARAAVQTYLWTSDQAESRSLVDLLTLHGIEVGVLNKTRKFAVSPVGEGEPHEQEFPAGTFTATADQPLGNLLQTLLEPQTAGISPSWLEAQRKLVEAEQEPEFFDITAWSLAFAFNLKIWKLEDTLRAGGALPPPAARKIDGQGEVGYLVPPQGLAHYRLAAALQRNQIRSRLALSEFTLGGRSYPAGTLFIPRVDNPPELDSLLERLVQEERLAVFRAATSFSETGLALGSNRMLPIHTARVGLVAGDGTSPTSFGFTWHLLDEQIEMPLSRLNLAHLGRMDLADFDVLILPDGNGYERYLSGESRQSLATWVQRGGVLVAIGSAFEWLHQVELTKIKAWKPPAEDSKDGEDGDSDPLATSDTAPLERQELLIPGSILATEIAAEHVLAVGVSSPPPVLFYGSQILLPTGSSAVDVLTVRHKDPVLGGFVWPEAVDRLRDALLVSSEQVGQGRVILFAQEPAFRLFWRGTMPLFLNAVMFGPTFTAR